MTCPCDRHDDGPSPSRGSALTRRSMLAGGLAGNRILDRKAAGMIKGEFEPGFRIDLHHKDLGIVTQAAREAGVILPVGATMAQLMGAARERGYGSLDHSALLKLAKDLSGRS